MTAHVHLNAEFDRVRIECDDDGPTLRFTETGAYRVSCSLTADAATLDALEAAIKTARLHLARAAVRAAA